MLLALRPSPVRGYSVPLWGWEAYKGLQRLTEAMRAEWGRGGRKTMPDELNPALWRSVVSGYPTLPITELHHEGRPSHWDTPEYRQDVPK